MLRAPRNTGVPLMILIPGRVIWADEDGKKSGLHANFKLSKKGEHVRLHDTDERGNTLLDSIEFLEVLLLGGRQLENVDAIVGDITA